MKFPAIHGTHGFTIRFIRASNWHAHILGQTISINAICTQIENSKENIWKLCTDSKEHNPS
jgi:hypothetical protein